MEHLSHCDSLPSNLHWLDIQKLTGTVTIFQRNFTPYKATLVTARYPAMNKKEKKKIVDCQILNNFFRLLQ